MKTKIVGKIIKGILLKSSECSPRLDILKSAYYEPKKNLDGSPSEHLGRITASNKRILFMASAKYEEGDEKFSIPTNSFPDKVMAKTVAPSIRYIKKDGNVVTDDPAWSITKSSPAIEYNSAYPEVDSFFPAGTPEYSITIGAVELKELMNVVIGMSANEYQPVVFNFYGLPYTDEKRAVMTPANSIVQSADWKALLFAVKPEGKRKKLHEKINRRGEQAERNALLISNKRC